jgi:hypothetical protein
MVVVSLIRLQDYRSALGALNSSKMQQGAGRCVRAVLTIFPKRKTLSGMTGPSVPVEQFARIHYACRLGSFRAFSIVVA